jgi:hypothetical protein
MGEALRRWATWDLLVSHAGTTRAAARAAGVSPTAGHFYGHRYRTVTDAMAARIDAAVVRLDLVAAPHPPGDETPSPAVPARARHSKRGRAEVAGADGRSQWDAEMRAALDATEHGTTERRRNKAWREVVRLLGESMLPREVVDHIGATESDWLAWTSQKGKTSRIVRRPVDTHHHDALRALAESELERMSVVESRPLSAEDATWRGYGPQPD